VVDAVAALTNRATKKASNASFVEANLARVKEALGNDDPTHARLECLRYRLL
jgi:hypothetical protein